MAPRTRPHRSLARRAGKAALWTVAALVAAVALAAAGGYLWLTSARGGAFLRARLVSALNAKLSGHLAIEAVRVHGLRFDAEGVTLTAPSGEVVARLGRVADVDLLPLARGQLRLSRSTVTGLVVEIDVGAGSVPLLRAVTPLPSAPPPRAGAFAAERLTLVGARIVVRQAIAPALARLIDVGPVDGEIVHGAGWRVSLAGAVAAPVAGPFSAALSTGPSGQGSVASADVTAPGLALRARTAGEGPRRTVVIERLGLEPATERALFPSTPVAVPLSASGTLATAGAGSWTFALVGASGALQARAQGTLGRGTVDVPRAAVTMPGLTAEGSASLAAGRLSATLAVRAADLAAAARAITGETGTALPIAGGGALRLAVSRAGPGAATVLRATGIFPFVSAAGLAARDLRVSVASRGGAVSVRAAANARPVLRARGRIAAVRGGHVAIVAALSARGPAGPWTLGRPARLTVAGGRVALEGLVLRGAGGAVSLSGALHRGAVRATLSLAGLDLPALSAAFGLPHLAGRASGTASVSGEPSDPVLSARVAVRGGPVSGVRALRLAAARASGGALRATLDATGPGLRAGARVERKDGVTTARLVARVRAGGRVAATARVGPRPPGTARDLPVEARLSADGLAAAALVAWIPGVASASGRIDAEARVHGAWPAPQIAGRITWRGGRLVTEEYGRLDAVSLAARADERGWSLDQLRIRSGRGRLDAWARGVRGPDGTRVDGGAVAFAYPVVTGGQLRARAFGRAAVRGVVGDRSRLLAEVSGAELRLPANPGGSPGAVRRPGDIHLVARDTPISAWPAPAPPARPAPPRPEAEPAAPSTIVRLATRGALRVRGDGVDVSLVAGPGLRVVRAATWLVFGTVAIPGGTVQVLGQELGLLGGSEIRFAGPPSVPFVAVGARGAAGGGSGVLLFAGAPGALRVGVASPGTSVPRAFAALAGGGTASGGPRAPAPPSAPLALLDAQVPLAVLIGRGPTATSTVAGTPITGRVRVESSDRLAADRWRGESSHLLRLDVALRTGVDASLTLGDAGDLAAALSWSSARP